jgi:hypothetical protein
VSGGPALPEPAGDPRPRRYVAPPWSRVQVEHLPTPLPLSRVVGVVDGDLALTIGRLEVFPAGLVFVLRLVPRPGRSGDDGELYAQLTGYGAARLNERLRVGLRYEDGRVATNRRIHGPDGPDPPEAAVVTSGAHGDGTVNQSEHWAWPIPEAGDLQLLFAWPSRGLAETAITLDGSALREASDRSATRPIWPGATLPGARRATGPQPSPADR